MLDPLTRLPEFCGRQPDDMQIYLAHHACAATARHCLAVAAAAGELAERFGLPPAPARLGGWLHDISAVYPNARRVAQAQTFGLEILPVEAELPMLLHQKLSAVLAQRVFQVDDPGVLAAIGCHTTLRPAATALDLLVFVADKLAWDQPGAPPYLPALQAGLGHSLAAAALAYLDYLWEIRASLPAPLHPWALAARGELQAQVGGG